ncbi:MAG: GNAT family N-acetyltransferase [Eubacterium sp.]|nr:GNAT family N-acetyltransferase [Eubacterium sp.]
MKIEIVLAKNSVGKEIIRNLNEKYFYECSFYENMQVDDLGNFGYDYLDAYFTDDDRWAYILRVDDRLAGFAMVNKYFDDRQNLDFSMAEFFILRYYQGKGIGRYFAHALFDKHRGKWQVAMHSNNKKGIAFWNKIIRDYTNGDYEFIEHNLNVSYPDGTLGHIIYFNSEINA